MNIVLFRPHELSVPLAENDPRAVHILEILGRGPGQSFDAGVVDGPMGRATVVEHANGTLRLSFKLDRPAPPLHPLTLLVGAVRPVAAQRILRETASLGVAHIWVCGTDRGEVSYLSAGLWRDRQWERHLVAGAEQAFSTRLPEVRLFASLAEAAGSLPGGPDRIALDNYEAGGRLAAWTPVASAAALAVGPERGWSAKERAALREGGFALMSVGARVLRTETACILGVGLVLSRMGRL